MADADITAQRLRELFTYEPETGLLRWRVKRSWNVEVGSVAGSINSDGYRVLRFDGRIYQAHRVVWLLERGEWPSGQIDHINGDRLDNRVENLRDVSGSINTQNQRRPQKNNKGGYLGVYYQKLTPSRPWAACISIDGRRVTLGRYDTPEQAHAAYVEAKRKNHAGCTL